MSDERKCVFISIGSRHLPLYDEMLMHLMEILEGHKLRPRVIEVTDPNIGRPLDNVTKVMSQCHGAIIVAFERKFFSKGIEKKGSDAEYALTNISMTTPWSQIEAAMAHQKKLPILMLVENGIHLEGLIDENYDWFLQYFPKGQDPLANQNVQTRIAQWTSVVRDHDHSESMQSGPMDDSFTLKEIWDRLTIKTILQIGSIISFMTMAGFAIGRYFPAGPTH